MPAIRLTLDKALEERGISRYKLAAEVKRQTGYGESTVYGAVRGQFLPRLETLAAMLSALEELSGKPIELCDVLEYDRDASTPATPKFSSVVRRKASE